MTMVKTEIVVISPENFRQLEQVYADLGISKVDFLDMMRCNGCRYDLGSNTFRLPISVRVPDLETSEAL